ncbi:IS30 family transposase [Ralstonia pseudosolanacearum]|uniref:IS30 family transposase n=2 Tax=Ralstonia solanacearum species complex TaxID=3116862 RepID=A0AA92Q4M6_RALSL|nr:IS30 family transposase [Ralstonia pseudosolanacearum]QOK90885.1 IS30 family transposase [Ralstonia pseudosolanacearum]QOK95812.1 IS30 family transposase [Ralstonia pseudosolanacearum]UWD88490.1 IS30 family transposase [Ralstonia pseudosolanacearum]UWD89025.1 IS30 family transposase [Ralstonia pseudosolanacearum]
MKKYKHLSAEERAVIMIESRKGSSVRGIARLLGRNASTISRELVRNGNTAARHYDATQASSAYRVRRQGCVRQRKLRVDNALYRHVHDRLVYWRWSPQQIAARLRRMHPDDPGQRVSHETIYAAIYAHPRGELKQAMIEALRQEKHARGRRRTTLAGTGFVPEELRIVHRPEQIELRQWPGHWEGDLIKGAFNRSCVGTLVERKTRFVVLCRMDGCTAKDALEGFTRQMKKLPAFLRESLTYDRGTEMTCHVELAKRLNLDIWFADPHAPWQRGSNENTNGLLRQFLPKGMDLSAVTQTQLNDIAKLLNGRPRQTLGWDTPEEAMAKELEKAELAKRCT